LQLLPLFKSINNRESPCLTGEIVVVVEVEEEEAPAEEEGAPAEEVARTEAEVLVNPPGE